MLLYRLATSHFQFSFLPSSLRVGLIRVIAGALKLEVSVPTGGASCLRWSSGEGKGAFSECLSLSSCLTQSPSFLFKAYWSDLCETVCPLTLEFLTVSYSVSPYRRSVTAAEKVPGLWFPRVFPGQQPFYSSPAPVQPHLLTAQEGGLSCPALSPLETLEFAQSYNVHTTYILCFSLI